jgi:hypothetical protein
VTVLIRALAAALLGSLLSAALLAALFVRGAEVRTDLGANPPTLVTGLYHVEHDPGSGLTFAWTGPELAVRLPGADRRVEWTLTMRARAMRADMPTLAVYVDGAHVLSTAAPVDFGEIRVPIPAQPDRRGMLVVVRVSPTFVPGSGDTRQLGVMLDRLTLAPQGVVLPPAETFAGAAAAGGALGAAIALLGVTPGSAIGAALLLGAGQAAMLSRGFAPYAGYATVSARLGVTIGAALVLVAAALQWHTRTRLRNTARFALAFSAGALFLKLLALLHPEMPLGDALFQAHRFQQVLAGNLYFTSVAPGNYQFPYAPGLYVTALPFAGLVARELGDVALLRVVVASADAIAAVLLYFVVVRGWSDRLAGAIAVALYHLIPLGYGVIVGGNLTNSFAQSVAVIALAIVAAPWLRADGWWPPSVLAIALAAAFMSHTSTFAILAVSVLLIALLFRWRGGPALRSAALGLAMAGLAALVLAVVLYYGHFWSTYRSELARIGSETATAAPDAGGRGIVQRLGAVPSYLFPYLTYPILILAVWGAAYLWRRGSRDRLTLSIGGWALGCGLFLVLGVLTPVDMRYYLAAMPAVSMAAAIGASAAWSAGGGSRVASAFLLAWAVWVGVHHWWNRL